MKFDDLLSRADDELLQNLVGRSGLKLLTEMDLKLATPTNLRKTAIGLHSREGLLRSSNYRPQLFDLLKPNEAESLVSLLGLDSHVDTYEVLKVCRFLRGSAKEEQLFAFFDLALPQELSESGTPQTELAI